MTTKAKATKGKNRQVWLPQNLKKKCRASKDTIKKVNRQSMGWEKRLANYISDMGLVSEI